MKYDAYQITDKPFVIIKADSGTYGMGVMSVYNREDILNLNRKERSRMQKSKGNQPISHVILQEGVYTLEKGFDSQSTAEPVLYMLGSHVIGGFYRVHKDRSATENLNAPGMQFEPMPFTECCNYPDMQKNPDCEQNRLYVYSVIARLAYIAAQMEAAAVGKGA